MIDIKDTFCAHTQLFFFSLSLFPFREDSILKYESISPSNLYFFVQFVLPLFTEQSLLSLLPQESGDEVESKEHYESQIGWHHRYSVYETIPVSDGSLSLRLKN